MNVSNHDISQQPHVSELALEIQIFILQENVS